MVGKSQKHNQKLISMGRATTDTEIISFTGQHSCMDGCRRGIHKHQKKLNSSSEREGVGKHSKDMSLWV